MVIDLFHICHGADIPSISRLTEGDCILHDTEQVARSDLKDIEKYHWGSRLPAMVVKVRVIKSSSV